MFACNSGWAANAAAYAARLPVLAQRRQAITHAHRRGAILVQGRIIGGELLVYPQGLLRFARVVQVGCLGQALDEVERAVHRLGRVPGRILGRQRAGRSARAQQDHQGLPRPFGRLRRVGPYVDGKCSFQAQCGRPAHNETTVGRSGKAEVESSDERSDRGARPRAKVAGTASGASVSFASALA